MIDDFRSSDGYEEIEVFLDLQRTELSIRLARSDESGNNE